MRLHLAAAMLLVLAGVAPAVAANGVGNWSATLVGRDNMGLYIEVGAVDVLGGKVVDAFNSDVNGAYFLTALFSLGGEGKFKIAGLGDPFLDVDLEFTNIQDEPIDFSFSTVLQIDSLDMLPPMTSSLTASYVDNDGGGGIDASASLRAFPQTESLGGFAAQEIVLPITGEDVVGSAIGPDSPTVPAFLAGYAFPKLAMSMGVENLLPGDTIILHGRTELAAVPEPPSLLLAILSALAVCAMRRSGPHDRRDDPSIG